MISFRDILIEARERKKMLKKETAEYFGWTPMYYGRYESGDLLPTKNNLQKFANFIEISEDELWNIIEKSRRNKTC